MHYYKKNIGDYFKKAGRLSILQHGVYNLLMDCCYDREEFPTLEEAIDWTWASTQEEIEAVEFVLRKFFKQGEDGRFYQSRIQEEIQEYRNFCTRQAEKGKKGGRPKKKASESQRDKKETQEKPAGFSDKADGKPDKSPKKPKPLTTNQEPLTNINKPSVEDLFKRFWSSGICKVNRKKSFSIFEKLIKSQSNPDSFTEFLVVDIQKRLDFGQLGFDQMHPTTYLNGERWTDETPINTGGNYATINHTHNGARKQTPAERAREQSQIAISQSHGQTGQVDNGVMDTDDTVVSVQVGESGG